MTKAEQCATLRGDLFEAKCRIGKAHYHHDFYELVTACDMLAQIIESLLPEESPDSVQITDRAHDATKSGDPFPY